MDLITPFLFLSLKWMVSSGNPTSTSHSKYLYGELEVAQEGQFPFIAYILYSADDGSIKDCGGILLSDSKVLTTPLCFKDWVPWKQENVIVYAGLIDKGNLFGHEHSGLQNRTIKDIRNHPKYSPKDATHNLAIIQLNKPFSMSPTVAVANISTDVIKESDDCTIPGFGDRDQGLPHPMYLHYAPLLKVAHVSTKKCPSTMKGNNYCILKGDAGICQLDYGFPLICKGKVIGLTSRVLISAETLHCSKTKEESVVSLSGEIEFLNSNAGSEIGASVAPSDPKAVDNSTSRTDPQELLHLLVIFCFLLKTMTQC